MSTDAKRLVAVTVGVLCAAAIAALLPDDLPIGAYIAIGAVTSFSGALLTVIALNRAGRSR